MSDFAHHLRLDQIHDGERIELVADERERREVSERLGLVGLDRFEAHSAMTRDGEAIRACGRIQAALEQSCVVTGDPVPAHVDEPFELLFVPEPKAGKPDEEIELAADECDVVFHDGAMIDLGAAIADTLALSLNPYPRSAAAEASLKDAGIITEEEAGPFAVLAQLKRGGGGES